MSARLTDRLTPSERQVAELLILGRSNGEIADAIGVSVKTVDTRRDHVLKKLCVRNNVLLVRKVYGLDALDAQEGTP